MKVSEKAAQENMNMINKRKKHRIDNYHQKHENMNSNQQCNEHQLYELTTEKNSENQK